MSVPDNQNTSCKYFHARQGQLSRLTDLMRGECQWIIVDEMRLFQEWNLLKDFQQKCNADQFMFYKITLPYKWRITGDGQEE